MDREKITEQELFPVHQEQELRVGDTCPSCKGSALVLIGEPEGFYLFCRNCKGQWDPPGEARCVTL